LKVESLGLISREMREQHLKQHGCTIWLTGLSGAGKSSIAFCLEKLLFSQEVLPFVLDADRMRLGLCRDLGFTPVERTENIRRCAEVAKLFTTAGLVTIASFISPYQADRKWVRQIHDESKIPFFECFIDAPLAVCKRRDPKGIYKMALKGELTHVTGIDDVYEKPEEPELHLRTDTASAEDCAQEIYELLIKSKIFLARELS
jgi:adenylyl-sulfate kinase